MSLKDALGVPDDLSSPPSFDHPQCLFPIDESGEEPCERQRHARKFNSEDVRRHLQLLHPEGYRGRAFIGWKDDDEPWDQCSVDHFRIRLALADAKNDADIYVSMNRFYGSRKSDDIADLQALYCDLDYYKTKYRDYSDEQVLSFALLVLGQNGIPKPSFVVFSGRGLQLVRLIDPIPKKAISRWNRCQQSITQCLQGLGADFAAKDAARVFRLAGTVNTKSGRVARLKELRDGRYSFDALADALLPYTRAEIAVWRSAQRCKVGKRTFPAGTHPGVQKMWQGRLDELLALAEKRWGGRVPRGHRNNWLFVVAVALSWIHAPAAMERELQRIASKYLPLWTELQVQRQMGTVIKNAEAAAARHGHTPNGKSDDLRYMMRSETIVSFLAIDAREMSEFGFRHLVDAATRKRIRNEDIIRRRREKGVISREAYRGECERARQAAYMFRQSGMTWAEIGKQLGISADAARKRAGRYRPESEPDKSDTVYTGIAQGRRTDILQKAQIDFEHDAPVAKVSDISPCPKNGEISGPVFAVHAGSVSDTERPVGAHPVIGRASELRQQLTYGGP